MVILQVTQTQPLISVSQHPPHLNHHYCLPKLSQWSPVWSLPSILVLLQFSSHGINCVLPWFSITIRTTKKLFYGSHGLVWYVPAILKNLSLLFSSYLTSTLAFSPHIWSCRYLCMKFLSPRASHFGSFSPLVYSSMKPFLTVMFNVPKIQLFYLLIILTQLSVLLPSQQLSLSEIILFLLASLCMYYLGLCTNMSALWEHSSECLVLSISLGPRNYKEFLARIIDQTPFPSFQTSL